MTLALCFKDEWDLEIDHGLRRAIAGYAVAPVL
jgi:hypothetical protein